ERCIALFNHIQINTKKVERVSSLSSDEVEGIFINYSVYSQRGFHTHNTGYEFR
ncbi:15044_t:CDS:1, partial [Funneliformis mosseae]